LGYPTIVALSQLVPDLSRPQRYPGKLQYLTKKRTFLGGRGILSFIDGRCFSPR
jgi:hypothetical protein